MINLLRFLKYLKYARIFSIGTVTIGSTCILYEFYTRLGLFYNQVIIPNFFIFLGLVLLAIIIFSIHKFMNYYEKNNLSEETSKKTLITCVANNFLFITTSIIPTAYSLYNSIFQRSDCFGVIKHFKSVELRELYSNHDKLLWLMEIKDKLNIRDALWLKLTKNLNLDIISNKMELYIAIQQEMLTQHEIVVQELHNTLFNNISNFILEHPYICLSAITVVAGIIYFYRDPLTNFTLSMYKEMLRLIEAQREFNKMFFDLQTQVNNLSNLFQQLVADSKNVVTKSQFELDLVAKKKVFENILDVIKQLTENQRVDHAEIQEALKYIDEVSTIVKTLFNEIAEQSSK